MGAVKRKLKEDPASATPISAKGKEQLKKKTGDLKDPLDRLADREDFLKDSLTHGDGTVHDRADTGYAPPKTQQAGVEKSRKRKSWKLLPLRRPKQMDSKAPGEQADALNGAHDTGLLPE